MRNERLMNSVPVLIHPIRVARWLSYQYQGTAWRIQSAAKGKVMAGPFKGMRIPAWQHRSYSELLGVYEHDIVPVIEDVIAANLGKLSMSAPLLATMRSVLRNAPEAEILAWIDKYGS